MLYLLSERSVLFPTSIMMTSLPLSVRTSSIHLEVCWKELASVTKEEEKQEIKGVPIIPNLNFVSSFFYLHSRFTAYHANVSYL